MKTIIETAKNYWGYFLVGLITLILLIHFTFFWYPILINKLFLFHVPNHDLKKEEFGRGTFGDMYGALNSFVSTISSVGAIIAILVQIWIYNSDKVRERNTTEEKLKNKLYFLGYTTYTFSNKLHEIRLEHNSLIRILKSDFFDNLGFIDYTESKIQFEMFSSMNFEEYFSIISEQVPTQRKNYFELLSLVKEIQKINSSFLPCVQKYLDEMAPMIKSFRQECEDFIDFLDMDKETFMKSTNSTSINEIKGFVDSINHTIDIQHLAVSQLYIEKRDKINSIFFSMNNLNLKSLASFMENQRKIEYCLKICNSINQEITNNLNVEF